MAEQSIILSGLMSLREMGFFDFFLPFILFFTIVYGALQKTKVFGEPDDVTVRTINSVIALVISLIASTTAWVIKGLQGFLPWVGFVAVALIVFLMLLAMIYGGNLENLIKNRYFIAGASIVITIALFLVLFYTLGFAEYFSKFEISDTDVALIIMGGIFLVAMWLIIKGGPSGGES